ncbi:Scr1 family TA system antitoxin-like transcriptional regulator [Streptomyces anulatus]|uniref:Scr1 family TA system antitoxin-like transcriptional regulator n=1 Tax=Streptomyces anulatus TaxID=1892 RepID=UPI0027E38786|nr:Scr1 family TA system antitoxin-like transcriptional regulator [Streptomyces anulatus]
MPTPLCHLLRVIGAEAVAVFLVKQLRKVADMAEAGRLRLHVVPFEAGAHSLQQSLLTLLSFADSAPVAYVEAFQTGNLMDDPRLVASSRTAYDLALGDALSHQESVARVRAAAEEHEHGHQ